MRSVQFTNHLVDDVEQLLSIADVLHQRFVLRLSCIPIHSVHRRIIETILHRAPGIAKHLGPFGGPLNFHPHIETNAPARCVCCSTGGRRCRGRRTERHRVNAATLSEEKGAAVARAVQVGNSSAESSATTAFAVSRRRLTSSHPGQPLAIVLNRINNRH